MLSQRLKPAEKGRSQDRLCKMKSCREAGHTTLRQTYGFFINVIYTV